MVAPPCHLEQVRTLVIAVVLAGAKVAYADHCADGVAALAKHDLPHAALYLDGCDDAEPKAVRELHKQLEASNLSVLQISSTPSGLDAEIDTLPGEHLVTPATVYVPAGEHEVRAGDQTKRVTTEARKHSAVIFESAAPKPVVVRDGKADFRGDGPDQEDTPVGPPPPTQHRPMMPCKYTDTCSEHGDQLDDPLAYSPDRPPPRPPLFDLGARAGAGSYLGGVGPSLGLAGTFVAPWSDAGADTHPWLVIARADWSHRRGGTSLGATLAAGKVIAAPETAWLSVAAGAHAGIGIEEMTSGDTTNKSNESGATLLVELALRKLPLTIGARYEQGLFAMHGDHDYEHAVIFDLGIGWRGYR